MRQVQVVQWQIGDDDDALTSAVIFDNGATPTKGDRVDFNGQRCEVERVDWAVQVDERTSVQRIFAVVVCKVLG